MSDSKTDEVRESVTAAYGARAREVAAGRASDCCGDTRAIGVRDKFYSEKDTNALPDSVVSYGCGNPIAIAGLQPGEVVLDLGSGAGLDCFLAAQRVGPEGRVIGLDMTDDMLELAELNKRKLDATNVDFRRGVMEAMPLPDEAVDVIISNCVINLSPDKDAVFAEALRVLRSGGRLHVSDVVLLHQLTASERADLNLWSGCIAGALAQADYARRLTQAGFVDVSVELQASESNDERAWRNATITAYKAGAARKPARPYGGETLELIAPMGLMTEACCGDDCCSM
jgi:SAM-dependent methyltransferase